MTQITFIEQLTTLTKGLLYMSESEYPFDIYCISTLAQLDLGQATEISPLYFLQHAATEQSWHDEHEKLIVARYQQLLAFITNSCEIIGAYKTKPPLATIYILLKPSDESLFVVLSTKVVET